MSDEILRIHLQDTLMVKLDKSFMEQIDNKLSGRDKKMIRSESTIDMNAPLAMLVTNFSSYHEIDDEPDNTDVISFETKPKSGVTEYVPTKV